MAASSRADCAPWAFGTSLPHQPRLGRMALPNGGSDRSGVNVWTTSLSWARCICAESCDPMLAITTKLEHIGHWIRMRQSLARFSASVSSFHAPSWADFITTTLAFRFSVHTGDLMGGGLPDIQDRLALQMVRPDLLRHHDASPPAPERGRRRRDRRSRGPAASSAYGAPRRATPAIAASAPRRWAGRRTDRTDVHCCEDGGERE